MPLPERSRPDKIVSFEARSGGSVTARVARLQTDVATRIADTAWSALHPLGAHRWRDGYETDADRGWSRYRGSRCTICDEPWEGW
jgi:hypothetical protein